ncbi:hypothetical protein [Deinococcus sp. NW-56]|nr:hypothetical protein [Deinococcus sp. NW-56]
MPTNRKGNVPGDTEKYSAPAIMATPTSIFQFQPILKNSIPSR